MAAPVDGVTYWFDWVLKTWFAILREEIPVTTPPDPTGGYGSQPYGTGTYGE
jgi:hypothetical protein